MMLLSNGTISELSGVGRRTRMECSDARESITKADFRLAYFF